LGVMISLVATPIALFFLYRIAEKLYDPCAARAAPLALVFLTPSTPRRSSSRSLRARCERPT
jgi:hypothetical protein